MSGRDPCEIRADLNRLFALHGPDTRRDQAVCGLDAKELKPYLERIIERGNGSARTIARRLLAEVAP